MAVKDLLTSTERAFHFVRFYPNPESEEFVNVALLVRDRDKASIIFDSTFQRIRCLLSDHDVGTLTNVLEDLSEYRSITDIEQAVMSLSPMLSLSKPRPLMKQFDAKTRNQLTRIYLERPRSKRAAYEAIAAREERSKLDEFLFEKLMLTRRLVQNEITPDKLFGKHAARFFHAPVPKISHSINLLNKIVLVDSISIHSKRIDRVAIRAERIGRAFWLYRRTKKDIEKIMGQKIITTGIVFNGHRTDDLRLQETYEYIKYEWENKTDLIVEPDKNSNVSTFREIIKPLID